MLKNVSWIERSTQIYGQVDKSRQFYCMKLHTINKLIDESLTQNLKKGFQRLGNSRRW